MREGMKPVMWAVAAAFVASLFFVGATTLRKIIRGESGGAAIVVIDGKKVGQQAFETVFFRELQLRLRDYQRKSQRPLGEEEERSLRLTAAGAAVNQIVQKELILGEARRMGLRVTNEEVRAIILRNPNFQTDGKFDERIYERFLAEQTGMTPGEFEAEMRDYILMDRVFALVGGAARISDEEARRRYDEASEKVRVAYAFLAAATAEPTAPPSDEQLKTYYTAHLDKYHLGQRVRIKYVFIDLAELRKKVKVGEADVKDYYERNKSIYFDAGEIRCRHILFAVKPGEPESAWREAERKAKAAAARARAGEDFGKLAAELSDDKASASRGGDLGYFGKGKMDPDFEAAAFALKEGNISGPVKSIFGYHVIKREADIPPYAEEHDKIKEMLVERAADEQATTTAMELRTRLLGGEGVFEAEAKTRGLKVKEAGPFEADAEVKGLGRAPRLAEEAFSLEPGAVGSVIPLAAAAGPPGTAKPTLRGYVVYQLTAKLEPGPAPFKSVRDRVTADYERDAALAATAPAGAELAARARESGDLEGAARAAAASYAETKSFTRAAPPLEVGFDNRAFIKAAFAAKVGEVVGPVRTRRGFYVLKILEKEAPDAARWATEGEQFRTRLREQLQRQILSAWYRNLVARAHVENNLSAYLSAAEGTAERQAPPGLPRSPLF